MTRTMNAIVFDLEVKRGPDELPGGWNDKHLMGVSCAGSFDLVDRRFRLIWGDDPEDLTEFGERLERADYVVGFNHVGFDYPVLRGANVPVSDRPEREVDLSTLVWKAIAPLGRGLVKKGNNLDALCKANGLPPKSGSGADAPGLFQRGRIGKLMTYQRDDVDCTWRLLCLVARTGEITLACGTRIPCPLPEPFGTEFRNYLGLAAQAI